MNHKSKKYIAGIDFLRVFALSGVVFYHAFPSWIPGGFLGVCLFFIISGYLLFLNTESTIQNKNFNLFTYFKRRGRKIYPALFVMVMSVIAFLTLSAPSRLSGIRQEFLSIFGGYNNWWQLKENTDYFARMSNYSPFRHLWFIGVELQLYLFYPFIHCLYIFIANKRTKKQAANLFLLLAVISGIEMALLYSPGQAGRVYYGTDSRAFSFFLGAYIGSLQRCRILRFCIAEKSTSPIRTNNSPIIKKTSFYLCLAVSFLLYLVVKGESTFLYYGGMFGICLIFCVFFISTIRSGHIKWIHCYPIRWLAKYSYLIYLWHYPLLFIFKIWRSS